MKSVHGNIPESSLSRKNELRDQIDLLRSRVRLLTGRDKLLMTMHFENGNSFRQLASLSGSSPATIARRIHKLASRLTTGEYITCLRHRDKFSKQDMAIARDYFLTGLSKKDIQRQRDISSYSLTQTIDKIRSLIRVVKSHSKDFRKPTRRRHR